LAHVNFGWGGASDGWYDFEKLAQDRILLYVFRIVPSISKSPASKVAS